MSAITTAQLLIQAKHEIGAHNLDHAPDYTDTRLHTGMMTEAPFVPTMRPRSDRLWIDLCNMYSMHPTAQCLTCRAHMVDCTCYYGDDPYDERDIVPLPDFGMCKWFALCANNAIGHVRHPILGSVAVCARCQEFADRPFID